MNKRDRDVQQTKQDLRDALARLVEGKPEHIEFREKLRTGKTIKINNSNVEKEAGKGNQALKRHPEIKMEIEKCESERLYGQANTPEYTGIDPVTLRTKERLSKSIEQRKKLNSDNVKLREELDRKNVLLKSHISHMDEMLAALWDAIPPEEIELRMESVKKLAEVININFKNKVDGK